MFDAAHEELAAVAAEDLTLLSPAELGERLREMHAFELAWTAQRLRTLEAFDRADGPADEGQLSTAGWMKTQLGSPHSEAAAEVGVARVRRTLPEMAAAFEAGRATFRHLRVVAAAMRRLPEPHVWSELDGTLTAWAQEHDQKSFAEMVDALVEQLRPEPEPKDETHHARRRLSLTAGFDGMLNLAGRLPAELGEKLRSAFSAASRPDAGGEIRTVGQRMADALDHIVDTVLDTALLPVDGGEKPHVTITVALDQLAEHPTAPDPAAGRSGLAARWGETAEHRTRRIGAATAAAAAVSTQPRFSWTGPTSPGTARRLCCDGVLLPIFTRDGQPIDVGRRTRVINAGLRAFVVARDRHCQAPGCTIPARWCQVHHVHHWRDGGQTTRTNLVLICHKHHRDAHSGRWVVVLHAPGHITFRRRLPGEPLYEIDHAEPGTGQASLLNGILATAARHLRSS